MAINHDVRKMNLNEPLVILCEDLDLGSVPSEIERAVESYNRHAPGSDLVTLARNMAKDVRPYQPLYDSTDEMIILIIHLARQGLINKK